MSKNTWLWVVIAVVIIGVLWYAGVFSLGGTSQSASVANGVSGPKIANSVNKTVADISAMVSTGDTKRLPAVQAEFAATVSMLSATLPKIQAAVNVAINTSQDVSAAQKALQDLTVNLSYLQSMTLSLNNAPDAVRRLNAAFARISTLNTILPR